MFELTAPLRALAVGLAGVGLAWLWFNDQPLLAVLVAAATVLAGLVLDWIGRSLLPQKPVLAVRFMEWWLLTPAGIAALASAVVVFVTVGLTVPEGADVGREAKQLISTLSTGLTAFVTAGFISWAGDDKDSRLGEHIKAVLQDTYIREGGRASGRRTHPFPADSPGERWVYSNEYRGIEGWGRTARIKRAEGIAAAMA